MALIAFVLQSMPIILVGTYSKKLGLPNFSSHSFTVSLSTEITELGQAESEASKLYALLQQSVDRELSDVGYLPDATVYGMNGYANGNGRQLSPEKPANASIPAQRSEVHEENTWACSEKQHDLIEKVVRENELDRREVDGLAKEMFDGIGVRQLNRLQASGFIKELLERHGGKRRDQSSGGYRGRFQHEQRGASR